MKTKDKKDLFTKNIKELTQILKEKKDSIFSLRMLKVQEKLKNKKEILFKRKDIARILTILKQKQSVEAQKVPVEGKIK